MSEAHREQKARVRMVFSTGLETRTSSRVPALVESSVSVLFGFIEIFVHSKYVCLFVTE